MVVTVAGPTVASIPDQGRDRGGRSRMRCSSPLRPRTSRWRSCPALTRRRTVSQGRHAERGGRILDFKLLVVTVVVLALVNLTLVADVQCVHVGIMSGLLVKDPSEGRCSVRERPSPVKGPWSWISLVEACSGADLSRFGRPLRGARGG